MRYRFAVVLLLAVFHSTVSPAHAQSTFAGNAQHTAIYAPAAQALNSVRWSTPLDLNAGTLAHYGQPLISAANTIFAPIKTGLDDGFRIDALDATTGAAKYTLATDYAQPPHVWILAYQPVLAPSPGGTRLYYAGAGGTLW